MNGEAKAELISKIAEEVREATRQFDRLPLTQSNLDDLERTISRVLTKELSSKAPRVKVTQVGTNGMQVQFLDEEDVPWHLYPLLKRLLG